MKLIFLALFLSLPLHAKNFTFGTFEIPSLVEKTKSGYQGGFYDLVKKVGKRLNKKYGYQIEIKVFPAKRAVLEFLSHRLDGLFPGLDIHLKDKAFKSIEIWEKRDFLYRLQVPPPKDPKQVLGKIGITSGYPYLLDSSVFPNSTYEEGNSDYINLKKLKLGRVQYFIGEELTALKASLDLGIKNLKYSPENPQASHRVYVAIRKDEKLRLFYKRFNQELTDMVEKGEWNFRQQISKMKEKFKVQ